MQGNNVALFNVNIPVFVVEMEISLVMCEHDLCLPCRTKVLYGRNSTHELPREELLVFKNIEQTSKLRLKIN
jgi:hypothetical protein